jgi:hypothetical protein
MQAHAFTRTLYFYSLNVIISHPTLQGRTGYVLSLRGLPLPLTCVFVTVNEARNYIASIVLAVILTEGAEKNYENFSQNSRSQALPNKK